MPDDLDVLAVARGPRVGDEDAVEGEVLFCPLEFFLMMMERKAVSKGGEEEEDRKKETRRALELSPFARNARGGSGRASSTSSSREIEGQTRARDTRRKKQKRERVNFACPFVDGRLHFLLEGFKKPSDFRTRSPVPWPFLGSLPPLALSGMIIVSACNRPAAAERPPRHSLAAGGRSAKHQRRAPMLLRRAASNETSTSTSPASASPASTSPAAPPTTAISAVVGQILPFRASPAGARRVSAPSDFPTIVILPGFGNAAEDYTSSIPTISSPREEEEEEEKGRSSPLSSLLSSLFPPPPSPSSSAPEAEAAGEGGEAAASLDSESLAALSPPLPLPPPPQPSLAAALESRGFSVAVVPVRRSDWFRVARCAIDPAYWRGEAEPETVSATLEREREREREGKGKN